MRPWTGSEWRWGEGGWNAGGAELDWCMGAWHRLEQFRFVMGRRVKGLEERRNLGSSMYKLRYGRALYRRGQNQGLRGGTVWVETRLGMVWRRGQGCRR